MKDFFVILIIFTVVFVGNYFIQGYIENTGKEFLEQVADLKKTIKGDEKKKKQYIENLQELWEQNEEKWIMIGYHQEINEIEDLMIESYSYYLQGELEDLERSYRKLERCVEDLKNREKLTLTNVF